MKKFVLLFAFLASVALGIEVTGVVGINSQTWDNGNGYGGSGMGAHGGILGGIGISPSRVPVYLGVETGFLYQKANYTWEDSDLNWHYNNLVIPILLKGTFKPTGGFHIGVGIGPSIISNMSGYYDWDIDGVRFEDDFTDDELETDMGLQIKGDVGIKLVPLLWLKPSVTVQLNLTADEKDGRDQEESETALFLSLGLAIKP